MATNILKTNSPFRFGNLASDPAGENGTVYYNSTDGTLHQFVSGAWDVVVTKTYADAIAAGFNPKQSVRAAITAPLPNTPAYLNGVGGVGATLTSSVNTGFPNLDGVTVNVGERVLIMGQAAALQNGIYTLTDLGVSLVSPWVLTRATDFDGSPANEVGGGDYVYVIQGTNYGSTNWVVVSPTGSAALGTDAIVWSQVSGATSLQSAYQSNGTITTSATYGQVTITGDQGLTVQNSGALYEVARFNQTNAATANTAVTMTQDGTGTALSIANNGTGGSGIEVSTTNAAASGAATAGFYNSGLGQTLALNASNAASTATVQNIQNTSAGIGLVVSQSGNAQAAFLSSGALVNTPTLEIVTASTGGLGSAIAISVAATATAPVILVNAAGTSVPTLATAAETGASLSDAVWITSGQVVDGISGQLDLLTGAASGNGGSGAIVLQTGECGPSGSSSGGIVIGTGPAPTSGNSGQIQILSGNTMSGQSGDVSLATGAPALAGASGNINLSTGSALGNPSGNIICQTGYTNVGSSGYLSLGTGSVTAIDTGAITISSGGVAAASAGSGGNSGSVTIKTGNAGGSASVSGDLFIQTGDGANATTGNIIIQTGLGQPNNGGSVSLYAGTSSGNVSLNALNHSFTVNPQGTLDRWNGAFSTQDRLVGETMPDNATTVSSSLQFVLASWRSSIVNYKIIDGAQNTRVGRLMVVSDGVNISLTDEFTDTADVGVSWTAAVVLGSAQIGYTTTSTGGLRYLTAQQWLI